MNKLLTIGAGVALLGMSSCACAATIVNLDDDLNPLAFDGTFVGFVDQFVEAGTMCTGKKSECGADDLANSNPDSETLWVNSVLTDTVEWVVKTEPVPLYATDLENVFAVALASDTPEYFLVKNSTHVALFQNDLLYNWGVFDISQIGTTAIDEVTGESIFTSLNMNIGDITVSHVSEFSECIDDVCGRTVVPIPPAIWLFGAGLLGLVGVARRNPA